MLQIRLSKPANESRVNVKPAPVDTVTVACPDHLVLADLPVVKSLGSPCSTAVIKTVGRRSRRQLGERVHFCVRCDFPIAIYGRLSPCEHAFCLDCARSDSLCYLCDDRIQRIQTIKMMERIFICAAPHCLKSFLKRSEFESHIRGAHADLLNPKREKEANESEAMSARKPSASDTTVQTPVKLVFSPRSHPPANDREDKIQLHPSNRDKLPLRPPVGQPRPVPIFSGQVPNYPSEQHPDSSNQSNIFPQQAFDSHGPGGSHQDSGGQQFFSAPYETTRPDSTPKPGSGQGPLMGLSTGPVGRIPFPSNYPPLWNMVPPGTVPLEPPLVTHGPTDGITTSDPQSRGMFRGDHEQNTGFMPMNAPPSLGNKGAEQGRGGNFVNPREGRGILAAQPMGLPPPPPLPPPHLAQMPRGRPYSGDGSGNRDAPPPGFGWYGRRDGFGGGQD